MPLENERYQLVDEFQTLFQNNGQSPSGSGPGGKLRPTDMWPWFTKLINKMYELGKVKSVNGQVPDVNGNILLDTLANAGALKSYNAAEVLPYEADKRIIRQHVVNGKLYLWTLKSTVNPVELTRNQPSFAGDSEWELAHPSLLKLANIADVSELTDEMEFLLLKSGTGDEPQFVRLTWVELKGLIAVKAGRIDFGSPRQLGNAVISEVDFLIFQTRANSIAGTNFNFGQSSIILKNAKLGFPIRFTIDSKNAGDTLTGFLATSGNSTVTLNGLINQVVTVDQIGYTFLGGMRNDIEVVMIDTNRFEVFVNPKI